MKLPSGLNLYLRPNNTSPAEVFFLKDARERAGLPSHSRTNKNRLADSWNLEKKKNTHALFMARVYSEAVGRN